MAIFRKILEQRWLLALSLAALLALAGWGGWRLWRELNPPPPQTIIVALPAQLAGGSFYVGLERKLFEKHGIRMKLRPFALGKQALQSLVQGNSDLAVLADTPFVLAVLRGEPLVALSTVYESQRMMALVARADHGIHTERDLAGRRIGTLFGTNGQYFLDTYMNELGLSPSEVQVLDLAPETIVTSLETGHVDAVTTWFPERGHLQSRLGRNLVTLQPRQPFTYRFLLAGRPDYVAAHQEVLSGLLQALQESDDAIRANPDAARTLIAQSTGNDPAILNEVFRAEDFTLHLRPSLLTALEAQGRWAMARGIVAPAPLPDFRQSLATQPLMSAAPAASASQ